MSNRQTRLCATLLALAGLASIAWALAVGGRDEPETDALLTWGVIGLVCGVISLYVLRPRA